MQEVHAVIAVSVLAGAVLGASVFALAPYPMKKGGRNDPPSTPKPSAPPGQGTNAEIDGLIVERVAAYFNSGRDGLHKVVAAQEMFGRRHAEVLGRFAELRDA